MGEYFQIGNFTRTTRYSIYGILWSSDYTALEMAPFVNLNTDFDDFQNDIFFEEEPEKV